MPIISVIVPVYNVEKELKRCVDSILKQTLKEIEIILVNDGSQDRSPQICNDYLEIDPRVLVIHQENGGLSQARNVGLLKASGEYVLFVDSDDYISSDACEKLYEYSNDGEIDIVIGKSIRSENGNANQIFQSNDKLNQIISGESFLKEQLKNGTMHMMVSTNLFKRDFLIEHKLFFKKGILHEDEQWTPRVFLKANKVLHKDFSFYYYVIRDNSITTNPNKTKNGLDLIKICYELGQIYEKVDDPELKNLLNDYIVTLFLHGIHAGNLYDSEYSSLINKPFLIRKAKSQKNKLKVILFLFNKRLYKRINVLTK